MTRKPKQPNGHSAAGQMVEQRPLLALAYMGAARKQKQAKPFVPVPLEKDEERWADRAAELLGYEIKRLTQRRPSKIALGLPDRIYAHRERGILLWAELKSEKGKLSAHQKDFHELLRSCGQQVIVGTARDVGKCLTELLLARQAAERLTEKR